MLLHDDDQPVSHQRSPRTDPDLRDGDSGHGNPGDSAGDQVALDSDRDVETVPTDELTGGAEQDQEFERLLDEGRDEDRSAELDAERAAHVAEQRRLTDEAAEPTAARPQGPDGIAEPEVMAESDEPRPRTLPIPDYDGLTVQQVLQRAKDLDAVQLAEVLAFEQTHRNRKTLVARLTRLSAN